MNPIDKLSQEDKDLIEFYISTYAGREGNSFDIPIDFNINHILRFWNRDKVNLFNLFGSELILTKTISIKKPSAIVDDELDDALFHSGAKGYEFTKAFYDWTSEIYRQSHTNYRNLRLLLSFENLSNNIYDGENIVIMDRQNKPIYINTGSKVSKMLGKLATAFKLPGYEDFRIAHSMCLNTKNIKGEVCLSIHPLDYMTMSDNNCDWSSCMAWSDGGDYRQGTVEMMNSAYVVVAYLKATEDMKLDWCGDDSKKWNNKRWRKLFIVSPDLITGIKGYPYDSDELNGVIMNWLKELVQASKNYGPYCNNSIQFKNHHENYVAELQKKVFFSLNTNYMYNDLHYSDVAFIAQKEKDIIELNFSGESECMGCGRSVVDNLMVESLLLCDHCEFTCRCTDCGDVITDMEDAVKHNGEYYCAYCFNENYDTCDYCGILEYRSDLTPIFVHHKGNKLNAYQQTLCHNCLKEDSQFTKEVGKIQECSNEDDKWFYNIYLAVDTKDLTEDGYEFFYVDEEYKTKLQEENAAS